MSDKLRKFLCPSHLFQFVEENDGEVRAVVVDVVPVGGVREEDVRPREAGRPLQVGVDLLPDDEVALGVLGGHGVFDVGVCGRLDIKIQQKLSI